ncbi:hypothetical protein Ddye_010765 [Dipteronia dyeriana]|uniref:Uncharacterized protein n=1 Tax=Dipteronia dyeriana TaxID=168575 RepID=A0AAD9XES3_9ROSI|nr:hypothetical protein Ddye_010765 [Dipteronia dyeriana]
MQEPRVIPSEEISIPKPGKKKIVRQKASLDKEIENRQGSLPRKMGHKSSKRNSKNDVTPSFQQQERSNSDSLQDSSASGNEYRALRRKYLLLEEESFVLGRNLREVEDDVKTLEDEKLALLDQLVVLEGLIDPSEVQPQGSQFS